MSVTSKGRGWEIRHSLWIGWTFTFGFLSWVSFLYIGLRVTQKGWLLWGFSYLIPLALVVILASVGAPPSLGVPALLLMFVSGIGSIVHAFLVRKDYLRQLADSRYRSIEKDETLEEQSAMEHQVASEKIAPKQSTASCETTDPSATTRPKNKTPEALEGTSSSAPSAKPKPSPARTEETPERVTAEPANVFRVVPEIYPGDSLMYQISSSYPFPLAFGFRSLMSVVDARDLYREQLRIAENLLAFLASVSLSLLREQDRDKIGIDSTEYWLGGTSPGDWKDIIGRCSKVFAAYEDNPLALAISRLNIRSEKKGFGKDVAALIRAKNDYKHDRGPVILEDIVEASQVVQETLKRCMEALAFLTDYAIRQVEDVKVSRRGDEFLLKCLRYTGDHPSFPQEDVVFTGD